MKNFALIGAAGYVAPRHLEAIQVTGNRLLAAYDKHDSVGILDRYFPQADFFVEFERFDRHLEKLKREGTQMDYVSVCSPNYLHDAHVRFGLRHGADAICEKPLVLNPWNLDALEQIAEETRQSIYTILQLRLHPSVQALRQQILDDKADTKHEVDLTYITSRGHWYYASWKGDGAKSGGVVTNIGIHFFDMLVWIFGAVQKNVVHLRTHDRAAGYLELENARVRWFLSISAATLPATVRQAGQTTYRSLTIGGESFEFSTGFNDLHAQSYAAILGGNGFTTDTARAAIELVYRVRTARISPSLTSAHPLAALPLAEHPFRKDGQGG
ncbi:MAG: Gfo/Idh/MocA family oxidoreductase [Bacteroidota bacterium]